MNQNIFFKNGLLSSIPFLTNWTVIIISSFIADYLTTSNVMSKLTVRRLFTGLGMFIPMFALICLSFIDCTRPYLGVAFLTLGMAFK